MNSIEDRIAQIQQAKIDAQIAEERRINAEQEYIHKMARYERELEDLQRQQSAQRFTQAIGENDAFVEENRAAVAHLRLTLTAVADQLASLLSPEVISRVDMTFKAQQEHALRALIGVEEQAIRSASLNASDGKARPDVIRPVIEEAEKRLPNAVPVWAALGQWILETKDPHARQIRRGIMLAITGNEHLTRPTDNANWDEMIKAVVRQYRAG